MGFLSNEARKNPCCWLGKYANMAKPKSLGGLGIRCAKQNNEVAMAKLNWRLNKASYGPKFSNVNTTCWSSCPTLLRYEMKDYLIVFETFVLVANYL